MVTAILLGASLALSASQAATPDDPVKATKQGQSEAAANARHDRDLENDRALGKKYAAEVEKESKLSEDKAQIARLERIGANVAKIATQTPVLVLWGDRRLNPFEYQFKLLQGKDVNAFSLPGGYIYFYEGLMNFAQSDDEIAGVVAHEISHASLRHVATLQREQSKLTAIQLPLILLAIFTGGASAAANTLTLSSLLGQATGSGWSIRAEQAADYAGFQYMLKSNYDPSGMLTFMERLAMEERSRPAIDWGIYRTHPPSRERAESLTEYMRDANVPIRRSNVTTAFRVTVKPGDEGTVELLFGDRALVALAGSDALERADLLMPKLNAFFDETPELYEVQSAPSGWVMGRRQPLLQLTEEDALAAKTDIDGLTAKTVKNVRAALYSLGYRVWSGL